MPNETIGYTGIPSDTSILDVYSTPEERDRHVPRQIDPPEHLSDDAAREVIVNLATRFWRFNSFLSYKVYRAVINEWDELP